MKVSVLVPVYNVEEYLEECILSVLHQTFTDYELLLVDDGSTDTSPEICDHYASLYPDKIKTIHKKNEGSLITRRAAIRAASGEIVVFLDADDCLRNEALMRIHDAFCEHSCDMVMYNYGTQPDFAVKDLDLPFRDGACLCDGDKKKLYELICGTSAMNSLWMKAVKKEIADLLPDYSGFSRVTNGEDLLCTLPLVTNAGKIVYLDHCLYFYRQRAGSAVRTVNSERSNSIKTVHQELERCIDIWQMPELHAKHYAREVRGWIETLELLLKNKKSISGNNLRSELRKLAEDQYFRNAYNRMDAAQLSKKTHLLAACLYHSQFHLILLYGSLYSRAVSARKNKKE